MADFNIRSESVDVEQIMNQIRSRIREKRGVDYTEEQVRELATVRLEKFLDPRNLRSDLLEQFRNGRPPLPVVEEGEPIPEPPPVEPPYVFDDQTLFYSHRRPLRWIRKFLRFILKLFINPNTLNQVLHTQAQFNVDMLKRDLRRRIEFQQGFQELKRQGAAFERSRAEWNVLYYEVLHNLVLETTRNGIEVKNLRMRVEALSSRLDFSERRVRALEGVVQYRPEVIHPRPSGQRQDRAESRDRDRDRDRDKDRDRDRDRSPQRGRPAAEPPAEAMPTDVADAAVPTGEGAPVLAGGGEATGRRRRRRRRGRRGPGLVPGSPAPTGDQALADAGASPIADEGAAVDGDEPMDSDADAGNGDDEAFEESSDQTDIPDPDRQ